MIQIIRAFPVRRASALTCVWFKTGNPARPLACRWVTQETAAVDVQSSSSADPLPLPCCA